MKKQLALKIILIISILGLFFSGFLSYKELFIGTCSVEGSCQTIFAVPVCVYGFVMYLVVFLIALIGVKGKE